MNEKARQEIEEYWQLGDEWANSLTHGMGLVLSLAGFFFLIFYPMIEGHYLKLIAFSIFGISLILLYGISTFYHYCQNQSLKHFLRLLDHCAIYLLIAGSYTPFTLITLKGHWGWILFSMIWSLAAIGIIFKCLFIGRFNKLSLGLYLTMGWLVILAAEPLSQQLAYEGILWLAAGGFFYTFGTLFYVLDAIPFYHAIWHLFVLSGSICHYCAIFFYV